MAPLQVPVSGPPWVVPPSAPAEVPAKIPAAARRASPRNLTTGRRLHRRRRLCDTDNQWTHPGRRVPEGVVLQLGYLEARRADPIQCGPIAAAAVGQADVDRHHPVLQPRDPMIV